MASKYLQKYPVPEEFPDLLHDFAAFRLRARAVAEGTLAVAGDQVLVEIPLGRRAGGGGERKPRGAFQEIATGRKIVHGAWVKLHW